MPAPTDFEREKSELRALLASGLFSRAPSLEHLLTYVCEKYFEGHSENVKEYNIAVEALGRPIDFDQKKDSIVRVEAYRLRRRLSEYYAGDGANHGVHIMVPQGQYAPKFVFRDSLEVAAACRLELAGLEPPAAIPEILRPGSGWLWRFRRRRSKIRPDPLCLVQSWFS